MECISCVGLQGSLRVLSLGIALLTDMGAGTALAQTQDLDGPYTFGGNDSVQPEKVTPSGTGQPVMIGLFRARWAPNTHDFAYFQPSVDAAFERMNRFWDEATFGRANFTDLYLGSNIIDLPRSNDYYYHPFQKRNVRGAGIAASINFPTEKSFYIESDGQDVTVTVRAGSWSRTGIKQEVGAAIASANPNRPAPTFAFDAAGDGFNIRTTRSGEVKAKLEVTGNALPYLGFGTPALYRLGDSAPSKIVFGRSILDTVNFPAAQELVITTQGATTTVNFPAGNMALADVVGAIQAAYPGEAQQQPFAVEEIDDAVDSSHGFLVFKTSVDAAGGDHGFQLTVGGQAAAILGLSGAGVLTRHEQETLRGHQAVLHGFDAYANSLPAGTDVDAAFGNARMFVGILTENLNFRAHYSSASFSIVGNTFDVSFFAARQSSLGAFSHETGHALGLPDLYQEEPWQIGVEPEKWDVMACSSCDSHPVAYLKSRHHADPSTRDGQWIDEPRMWRITPPPGAGTRVDRFILTPVESPWIASNPFAASHPGVPVAHAVELVPTDEKDVFVIENRQIGPYSADHLGAQVDFSTNLPSRGVIIYNGRRKFWTGGVQFLPVNLVTPYTEPLYRVGDSFEHVITNTNRIQLSIVEVLPNPAPSTSNPSFSYLVEVRWGTGSFYDVAIRDWEPRPYESPDIWVDSAAANGWDVYTYHDGSGVPILNGDNVALREVNRLYARVHNLGDLPITQPITVIWRLAIPQVAGGTVETEYGRVTIPGGIPAKSSVVTPYLEWRPTGNNDGHVCWRVEIVSVPGEHNATLNNQAQENITQWFSTTSSPFTPVKVNIVTMNPFSDTTADVQLYVPDVPPGWTVTVEDVAFRLPPGGSLRQTAVVIPDLDYFQSRLRDQAGIIASFAASIEARTPVGDQWVPFGGVTAIVHPVNLDSRITIRASVREPNDGRDPRLDDGESLVQRSPQTSAGVGNAIAVLGELASTGPLKPALGDREINVRFDEGGVPIWSQTLTNSFGEFSVSIPRQFSGQTVTVQAFDGGGLGFNRASSPRLAVRVP